MKKVLLGVAIVMLAVVTGSMPAHATTVADMLVMIEVLQAENAAQQAQIDALLAGAGLEPRVAALEDGLATLDADTASAQLLDPFLTVQAASINGVAGPNVILTGINLHLLNGSGQTYEGPAPFAGHGNLIIGYNEVPGTLPGPVPPLVGRTGSHCLVLGTENQWVDDASFVGGARNIIAGPFSFIATGPLSATNAPFQALP